MSVEGIPEKAALFRQGAADGEIEIVGEIETFNFFGHYQGEPLTPRVALAMRTWDNADPDRTRVRSLVLAEEATVRLIGMLQHQLQIIQARAAGGDSDESRGAGRGPGG